jgi:hypothetical protein
MKTIKRDNLLEVAKTSVSKRLMISVPMTGLVRAEWMMARYGQTIPCNWAQVEIFHWMDQFSPLGFQVADARNVAVDHFIKENYEWLFFIDHDVILPPNTFIALNDRMMKKDIPIFGGLYFTRSAPSEPLLYRGRGNSYFRDWKFGDKIWVDAMGLGCHMVHRSILEQAWKESEEYQVGGTMVRQVFETPSKTYYDAEKATWFSAGGTEDLTFYTRLMKDGILGRAGWKKYQGMQYPYLCDTSLFCRHIDMNGVQYPAGGEEKQFQRKG